MGAVGIIGYLLGVKTTDEVHDYQQKTLKWMVDTQLLNRIPESLWVW